MAEEPSSPPEQQGAQEAASDADRRHAGNDDRRDRQQLQLLQALASDPAALQREVTRLATTASHPQLPQLAADLRGVVDAAQLEQLSLALLEAADAQSQPALHSLLDALLVAEDVSPLARLRVVTQRLRSAPALEEPERALLLRWGDHAGEQLLAAQDAAQAAETARLLLALHDAGGATHFKVATLVWKNLTRMATAFGAALADGAFQVDDLLASVVAALEQCVQQLCAAKQDAEAAAALKFLRLYWRAFQGQLFCFLSALTSEVEASVMALVNVAAGLVDIALLRRTRASPRLQAEASRLLLMVVALAEKLGAAVDASAATREQLRVLLWHADADMVRAIQQRRGKEGEASATSVRVAHLLVVAAFSAADDNVLPAKHPSEEIGGAKVLAAAALLLERYQTCAWHEPIGALSDAAELFLDFFLALLLKVDDVEELQLFLVQQLFHPDVARQEIVWEAWREFLCFGWDEPRAAAVLRMLIALVQCESGGREPCMGLALGVQTELLELIAFVYPDLSDPLKRVCVDEATEVVDAIFSEGPSHAFTLKVAAQVALLEYLAAASFIRHYDHPEKEKWVAKYLPMCFECCGTVLDLLNSSPSADLQPAERSGMMRILDVCLLVVKAVLDDSDGKGADVDELGAMLVPMSSEILTQLSKVDRNTLSRAATSRSRNVPTLADVTLERAASRTLSRILETSTYVLASLGAVLKRNQNNQCVLALRDLSLILERAPANEASGAAATIAWFASTTLFDVHVAQSDLEVVWLLFSRLFQNLSEGTAGGDPDVLSAPHLPIVLDAFYRFLAHSNVVEHPGGSLEQMLHESARVRFREFLALKALPAPDGVAQVFRGELSASQRNGARARLDQEYCSRFPGERSLFSSSQQQTATKRVRGMAGDASTSNEEDPGDSSGKRRKLDSLVSMCRRAHEMFGSPSPSSSLLAAVSEQELDAATRLLEQLLASGALA